MKNEVPVNYSVLLAFFTFFHREAASRLAIVCRSARDKLLARALPPFNPPNLPNATVLGSL
jgi:hypothetical protein